ncbi:MAG: site-2 protease family protein [Candidatus Woesebacteria bacterium]|jgi:Zn-dependent protease
MNIIFSIIAFLVALVIHEAAHAWMADRLGDPTAKLKGRLTLNPLAHLDIYGTVLVPLMLILIRSPIVFGWAKPVMFDPYNLKNPRKDSALISFAGPGANFIVAILLSIVLRLINSPFFILPSLFSLIVSIIQINVVLGIFNLIPIHPLDGGKIFVGLLPDDQAEEADLFLRRYGMIILILLIFPIFGGRSPLFAFMTPILNFVFNLLLP